MRYKTKKIKIKGGASYISRSTVGLPGPANEGAGRYGPPQEYGHRRRIPKTNKQLITDLDKFQTEIGRLNSSLITLYEILLEKNVIHLDDTCQNVFCNVGIYHRQLRRFVHERYDDLE